MKTWTMVAALRITDEQGNVKWLQTDGSVGIDRETARLFGTVTDAAIHRDLLRAGGSTRKFVATTFETFV